MPRIDDEERDRQERQALIDDTQARLQQLRENLRNEAPLQRAQRCVTPATSGSGLIPRAIPATNEYNSPSWGDSVTTWTAVPSFVYITPDVTASDPSRTIRFDENSGYYTYGEEDIKYVDLKDLL